MKKYLSLKIIFSVFVLFAGLLSAQSSGVLKMPKVFGDNMVLQRESPINFWGKSNPETEVIIRINQTNYSTKSDINGHWKIKAKKMKAGGPYEIIVSSSGDTIKFKNVMIGEVWLCSGQSNMEMPLAGWGQIINYKEEIASANFPMIRLFNHGQDYAEKPNNDVKAGNWEECSPETIGEFSAVGYFFGRELYNNLKVPIGLINTSSGGTRVEAWSRLETLSGYKYLEDQIRELQNAEEGYLQKLNKDFRKKLDEWYKYLDSSDIGFSEQWFKEFPQSEKRQNINLPADIDTTALAKWDGSVWFRKEFEVPVSQIGKEAKIFLPSVDDYCKVFLNGKYIFEQKRKNMFSVINVSADLLQEKNVLTLRILDLGGRGGIIGHPDEMYIAIDNETPVSLAGEWEYRIAFDLKSLDEQPKDPRVKNYPSVLFNAMIYPFIPYSIKGVIWYQGESNQNNYNDYHKLFSAMITDWRKQWSQGDFPFYFVQLANYMERKNVPVFEKWSGIREAQLKTLKLKNTGMAVTIDIGDAQDIHPKNKQEVGRRLSLIALNKLYGKKDIVPSGPVYKSYKIKGNKIVVEFDQVAKGLKIKGDVLKGFAIAGEDNKFTWADAKITGKNKVELSSEKITQPVAVRYGWANNPECNLYNSADLPASPFRTDEWEK